MFFIIFSFFKYLMLCLQLYLYFFIRKERFQRKSFLAGSSIKRNSSSLRQQTNNGSLCLASDYKECIVLFLQSTGPIFYGDQLVPIFLQSTGPNLFLQSTGPNFFANNVNLVSTFTALLQNLQRMFCLFCNPHFWMNIQFALTFTV